MKENRQFISKTYTRLMGGLNSNQRRAITLCFVLLLVLVTLETQDILSDEHRSILSHSNFNAQIILKDQSSKERLLLADEQDGDKDDKGEESSTERAHPRPIMHTFYHKDQVGEEDLLEYWKEAWDKAGWDTVVLDLEDAQKHPYYDEMFSVIDPLWGMTYNGLCYYRWLAMGASGGGWMSDYDLFPTNFPKDEGFFGQLPNGGNFTTFESHVPSLMSGRGEEWMRVTYLLVRALKEDRVENAFKSDMFTFLQLRTEGGHDIDFRNPWYNVNHGFIYKKRGEVDCKQMDLSRAVHLSHHFTRIAFENGVFPLEVEGNAFTRKRGPAAKVFLADWEDQCGGSIYDRDITRVLH